MIIKVRLRLLNPAQVLPGSRVPELRIDIDHTVPVRQAVLQ